MHNLIIVSFYVLIAPAILWITVYDVTKEYDKFSKYWAVIGYLLTVMDMLVVLLLAYK